MIEISGSSRVLAFGAGMTDSGIDRDWAATVSIPGVALLPDLSGRTVTFVAEQVNKVKRPGDIAVLSIHWGGNWGYEIPRQHQAFAQKVADRAAIDVVHSTFMAFGSRRSRLSTHFARCLLLKRREAR